MKKHRILLQINGCDSYRPYQPWLKVAAERNIETVWWDTYCEGNKTDKNFNLIIVQSPTTNCIVESFYWHRDIGCPVIGECGDAAVGTNINTAFTNLPFFTEMWVEGYDYWTAYRKWLTATGGESHEHKLRFLKICADYAFQPLIRPKEYDWCFAGMLYPLEWHQLKHYRYHLIKELYAKRPGILIGDGGWHQLCNIDHPISGLPQPQLNEYYAKSHACISIDAHDGDGYTSTRTLEIMYGGYCAVIYDHNGLAVLKNDIVDGVHAFYFKTVDECLNKIDYLKNNRDFAMQMGQKARELVLEKGWSAIGWLTKLVDKFLN